MEHRALVVSASSSHATFPVEVTMGTQALIAHAVLVAFAILVAAIVVAWGAHELIQLISHLLK